MSIHEEPTATGPEQPASGFEATSPSGWRLEEPPTVRQPAGPDALIGSTLGEYVVKARLGSGGMGLVYRGEQPLIGKAVAIKVLRPELAADADYMRRFLDEARAVNAVKHPGLVDIFSFGTLPGGGQYFVMELLEGESLEALLRRRGVLPPGEALPILEQAAAGLEAAHQAGVVHRDIKPSNIFLVKLPEGRLIVKLLDFGLAKLTRAAPGASAANLALGTPEYMSPEQATAAALTPATDVYALGCLMYELLTGSLPFAGGSHVEVMMRQVSEPPRAPSEVDPSVSPELERLVLRMLDKAPERRPSAREVRLELSRQFRALATAQTRVRGSPVTPLASATVAPATVAAASAPRKSRGASVPEAPPARTRWVVIAALALTALAAVAAFALR